ncbi:hypothetical protein EJB05_28694, partial [Eragrostis curvula]
MGVLLLRELFVNKGRGGCVGFIRGAAEEEEDGGGGPIDPDRAEPFDRVGVMGERGGGCKAGGALDLVGYGKLASEVALPGVTLRYCTNGARLHQMDVRLSKGIFVVCFIH